MSAQASTSTETSECLNSRFTHTHTHTGRVCLEHRRYTSITFRFDGLPHTGPAVRTLSFVVVTTSQHNGTEPRG